MTAQEYSDLNLVNLELEGWDIGALGIDVKGDSIIIARHPEHGKVVGHGRSDCYAGISLMERIRATTNAARAG
jgi:hypothetical protein